MISIFAAFGMGLPVVSDAAILVYRGTFVESRAPDTSPPKLKNVFLVFDDTLDIGLAIAWYGTAFGKQTEVLNYDPLRIFNTGSAFPDTTIFYHGTGSDSGTGDFSKTTRALSGRDARIILRKVPELVGIVPRSLTGTEIHANTLFDNNFRTRRFRVRLDLIATQEANTAGKSAESVRSDFLDDLVRRGYPPLP